MEIVSEGYVGGISGYFGVFRGILGELKVFLSVFEPKKLFCSVLGAPGLSKKRDIHVENRNLSDFEDSL